MSSDGSIQQVGASFGTAVFAVILQHQAVSDAASGNAGLATAFDPEASIAAAALWTDRALLELYRIRSVAASG